MEPPGYQTGDVGHVHHEIGLHLPGDLGKLRKFEGPGVGAGAGDDHPGAVFPGQFPHHGEVHLFALAIHTVSHRLIEAAGKIHRGSMAQMTAVGQVHAQDSVPGLEDGEIDRHVGLGAGMGLDVGVGRAEDLLHPAQGQVFGGIHKFAAAVEAPPRITFGILVGQDGALGLEHRVAHEIFRGDQLQFMELPLPLPLDDRVNGRINAGQVVHPVHYGVAPARGLSWANCSNRSRRSWWRPPSKGVPSQVRTISLPRSGPITRPPITRRLESLCRLHISAA